METTENEFPGWYWRFFIKKSSTADFLFFPKTLLHASYIAIDLLLGFGDTFQNTIIA